MQVVNQLRWNTLRNNVGIEEAEYREGKFVIQFCESWCNRMEEYADGSWEWREILSTSLPKQMLPYLEISDIGKAFVFIYSNWVHGEQFVEGLTEIERRMFVDAVQHMTAAQQLAAQDISKPEKHLA